MLWGCPTFPKAVLASHPQLGSPARCPVPARSTACPGPHSRCHQRWARRAGSPGQHWGGTGEALGEHWEDRRSSPVPHRTRTVRVSRCPADAERASPQPPGAPERVPGAQPPLAVPPGSRRSVPRGARGLAVTEPSPSRHRARLPPLHPFDVRAAQVPSAPQPAPLRPRTPSTGGSAPRCSLAVASPG